MIDVNVYLSRWPFRRLNGDETRSLVSKLREQKVSQAWAGSFDALLHRDVAAVNARLTDECKSHGESILIPFGTVNPQSPDWEEDLRRCHEVHRMPGIRLHPNYHGYKLDDPAFARLLSLAAERKLVVQIALTMEDERTQHPLVQVPHVDTAPLADLVRKLPKLKLVLLNAMRALRIDQLEALSAAGQVYFDIAALESVGGVQKLIEQVTLDRIVFGSYFPYFYFESALLKLRESPLAGFQIKAIEEQNAQRLLGD